MQLVTTVITHRLGCSKAAGFGVNCTKFSIPYTVQKDDMFAVAQSHGCFINRTQPLYPGWNAECNTVWKHADFTVFGVGYDDGPQVPYDQYRNISGGISITTVFKEKPDQRGSVSAHRCDLRQGTVEYDVEFTRDSITLAIAAAPSGDNAPCPSTAHPPIPDVRSLGLASAASSAAPVRATAAVLAPPRLVGQDLSDRCVASTPSDLLDKTNFWTQMFAMLFEPVKMNLSVTVPLLDLSLQMYLDCKSTFYDIKSSNTSCAVAGRPLLRDLSAMYAKPMPDEARNASADQRNIQDVLRSWRDPMQVCFDPLSPPSAFRMFVNLRHCYLVTSIHPHPHLNRIFSILCVILSFAYPSTLHPTPRTSTATTSSISCA
jgi:hypothetical protein